MSSLRDRLAAAAREQGAETDAAAPPPPPPQPEAAEKPAPAPAASDLAARRASAQSNGSGAPAEGGRRRAVDRSGDKLEELKAQVHTELLNELGPQLYDADMEQQDLESRVRATLQDVLAATERPLSAVDRAKIIQDISDDILGYGPIDIFLRDPDVSEVMVNGPDNVFLERNGRLVQVDAHFGSEAHLRRTIDKIVSRIGRRVDESSPMVDARLPDGSRVNAVIPPLAIDGSLAHHPEVLQGPAHLATTS